MSLNSTPSANRIHIGFFGKRNAGKSSVVNAVTGQDLAVVSDVKGTTTDPVYKSMELLPLGPVVIIDTPGIDDEGYLGEKRVKKSRQVLNKTDIAVLVVDAREGISEEDIRLIELFREKGISYIVVFNKTDLYQPGPGLYQQQPGLYRPMPGNSGPAGEKLPEAEKKVPVAGDKEYKIEENEYRIEESRVIFVSAKTGYNIEELKNKIARSVVNDGPESRIVGDIINANDFVVLVIPIDKAAPKGRLILPQQQTIRDILESGAAAVVVRDSELPEVLKNTGKKPSLVITDSQVFEKVSSCVPGDIPLTSFSILFARYKGNLLTAVRGAKALESLADGDTLLVSEGCTHHRQCDDIGTVKLPGWIKRYTGKELNFHFTSGTEFPDDLSGYKLVVHCGGCMLNEREMKYRYKCAVDQQIPITNYGILIAYMQGILKKSVSMFPQISAEFDDEV